jgi:parvulin-like peptidyl-prolyl isomerase
VLWLSHILIRHDQVESSDVSFSNTNWTWTLPRSTRSKAAALQLAEQLAEQARAAPERFASLALQYSEDPATRDAGGALGGVTATQFFGDKRLLDVFAATEIGSVSRVVETRHGFHIFYRQRPPEPALLSGARIVIAHDEAPWLAHSARAALPRRARADALALAQSLHEQLRKDPTIFDALVARYTEHADALRGGDFGTWSSREPTVFPREVELLQRLKVGEIAPPIDSLFGIELIRRTPNRERKLYRMSTIHLTFNGTKPLGDPASKQAVFAKARSFIPLLQAQPAKFEALQAEYCCAGTFDVVEGREPAHFVAALERLQPGEIVAEPLQDESTFWLPKLLARTTYEVVPSARIELPAPQALDFAYWLPRFDGAQVEGQLRVVAERASALLALNEQASEQLLELHELHGQLAAVSDQERLAQFDALDARVRELLGPVDHERYRAIRSAHFEQLMLVR